MKKVRIVVNDDHIKFGVKEDSRYCPVALAMKDLFKDGCFCEVGQEIIEIGSVHPPSKYPTLVKTVRLPREAMDKIVSFDNGFGMYPFEFELEIDEKFLKEEVSVN